METKKKQKASLINIIWLMLVLVAVICAAYNGKMEELTAASFDSAKSAVTLAIGLVGIMALWLGIMKVAEEGGLLRKIARLIRPLMIRLFPDVPSDHPAMSAMIMNIAANVLGLGNAATPLGIKAMEDLNTINPQKGTATDAMCLFLAINTSSVTLLPLGVIAVRAAAGATDPAGILFTSIFATSMSTLAAITCSKVFSRLPGFARSNPMNAKNTRNGTEGTIPEKLVDGKETAGLNREQGLDEPEKGKRITYKHFIALVFFLAFFFAVFLQIKSGIQSGNIAETLKTIVSFWIIPLLMGSLLLYGYVNGVKVYESLTTGAREGFNVALRIIPFLVAILVAVGMFRASGALDIFVSVLGPVTNALGIPADVLPMAIIRPLSGSGAFGVMSEVVNNNPDSFSSFLASTLQGSTETTFYVLAVYFGAVAVKNTRHALHAALIADLVGITAAVIICNIVF